MFALVIVKLLLKMNVSPTIRVNSKIEIWCLIHEMAISNIKIKESINHPTFGNLSLLKVSHTF